MRVELRKAGVFFSIALVLICSLMLLFAGVAGAEETADAAQAETYTVQFFSWDNSVLHTDQVEKGEPVAEPDVAIPEREYHEFSYWYDARGDRNTPYDFSQPVESKLTLKAFYSIKKDLKGGERAVIVYKDFGPVITSGEQVTVSGELIGFEGANVFLQWQYLDADNKWVNIEGANSLTYTFEASQETINRSYRLGVTILN